MANDFSGDGTYKLLYNLESGALTTDSIGSNTLTDEGGVTANTTDYKQGSASGDFESTSAQCLYCTDGDLDSGVPLKSGESNDALMVALWTQFESIPADIALWLNMIIGMMKEHSGLKLKALMTNYTL